MDKDGYDLNNSFKTLESVFGKQDFITDNDPIFWMDCPKCESKPRVWIFDNGRYAACKCNKKYDGKSISAIAISPYMKSNGGSMINYPEFQLRDNWNENCLNNLKIIQRNNFIDSL